ncbi:MAG: thioredoxin family protein [Elusimicrobiota bacterium]
MKAPIRSFLGFAALAGIFFNFQTLNAAQIGEPAPGFSGIVRWFNAPKPPASKNLKGKVVLVDFWTYSCVNCLRTLPHLEAWYRRYHRFGLEIIGIHSPEFSFEKDPRNVGMALKKYGVTYPVAMDNDLKTWDAYQNRYWPAHYFIDRAGVIRYIHFGEGDYGESERRIRALLSGGGVKIGASKTDIPQTADFSKIKSPEMYLGYSRLEYMGNAGNVSPDRSRDFNAPEKLLLNRFYFAGRWTITREFAKPDTAGDAFIIVFDASRANMVLSAGKTPIEAEITIDGKPATDHNKGTDVRINGEKTFLRITRPRLYNLTRAPYGIHTAIIKFLTPGARAYALTFG